MSCTIIGGLFFIDKTLDSENLVKSRRLSVVKDLFPQPDLQQ
jgi:hypothetical protein